MQIISEQKDCKGWLCVSPFRLNKKQLNNKNILEEYKKKCHIICPTFTKTVTKQ